MLGRYSCQPAHADKHCNTVAVYNNEKYELHRIMRHRTVTVCLRYTETKAKVDHTSKSQPVHGTKYTKQPNSSRFFGLIFKISIRAIQTIRTVYSAMLGRYSCQPAHADRNCNTVAA